MKRLYFLTFLSLLVWGNISAQCVADDCSPFYSGMTFSGPGIVDGCTYEGGTVTLTVSWTMFSDDLACTAPAGSWGLKISFPSMGEYGVSSAAAVTTPDVFTWYYDSANKALNGYSNVPVSFGDGGTVEIQVETYMATSTPCEDKFTVASMFKTFLLDPNPSANPCNQAFVSEFDEDATLLNMLGVDTPLPTQLTSFRGALNDCKSIGLSWATASELNNEKFILERKIKGENEFVAIAELQGAGNSAKEVRYSYDDEVTAEMAGGTNFYRLKQVDFNGKFYYSNIISINVPCEEEVVVNVFPNPVVKNLTLQLPSLWEGDAITVEFYNEQGKLVRVEEIDQVTDLKLKFDVRELPVGVYNLKLSNNTSILNKRFVRLD